MDHIQITKEKSSWHRLLETTCLCIRDERETKTFSNNKIYEENGTTNLVEIYKSLETHDHYS